MSYSKLSIGTMSQTTKKKKKKKLKRTFFKKKQKITNTNHAETLMCVWKMTKNTKKKKKKKNCQNVPLVTNTLDNFFLKKSKNSKK
jgi:hypothetical protein